MKKIICISLIYFISIKLTLADNINEIDKLFVYYADSLQFNGTVLIAQNGKPIYEKAFGYANQNWDISNTPDTKYRIYSMSKAFTAMIIYQLIQENKIGLKDKLKKYLPDFKSDTGNQITIHNLLTHTSGIRDYLKVTGREKEEIDRLNYSAHEFIDKFIDKGLEFEPGTKDSYSNSNYYLLSVIIEGLTGKKFAENIEERILIPLDMKNSGVEDSHTIIKDIATGYFTDFGNYTYAGYVNMNNLMGCGNLYSTADDLLKWDQALYSEKLIPNSLKNLMFTPLFGTMFASGWQIEKRLLKEHGDTLSLIRHSGGYWGFRSNIIRINNNQYTIIILSNTNLNNNVFMNIGDNLINVLFNEPFKYPKIPISIYINTIIQNKGIAKAAEEYDYIKINKPDKFGFHFIELKVLGENLSDNKRNDEALEIFRINTREYPDNWVVFADLAEAYFKTGDKINAIGNYKKCLEMNHQKNEFEIQSYKEIQEKLTKLSE